MNEVAEMQNMNISVQGGIGVTFPAGEMLLVKIGVVAHYGIMDIGGNTGFERNEYVQNTYATGPGVVSPLFVGLELGVYLNKRLK